MVRDCACRSRGVRAVRQTLTEREESSSLPMITIKASRGRTLDQKRELVKRITTDVVEVFKVGPELVSIEIVEGDPENWARGGVLSIDKSAAPPVPHDRAGAAAG